MDSGVEFSSEEDLSSSDDSDQESEYDDEGNKVEKRPVFVPRQKVEAYKDVYGKTLKSKMGDKRKLTSGTDPRTKNLLEFMVNDAIHCPRFLPMEAADAKVTKNVITASLFNSDIP